MSESEGRPTEATAAPVYANFIRAEFEDQNRVRASVQRRAAVMATTTGALVASAVAIASLLRPAARDIPVTVAVALAAGLATLVISLVCGINAQRPAPFGTSMDVLRRLTHDSLWGGSRHAGLLRVTELRLDDLAARREATDVAARWLLLGYRMQVIGIVLFATAAVMFGVTFLPASSPPPGGLPPGLGSEGFPGAPGQPPGGPGAFPGQATFPPGPGPGPGDSPPPSR